MFGLSQSWSIPRLWFLKGPYIVTVGAQDTQAVQGSLVRMARPLYQEDRMVEGAYM